MTESLGKLVVDLSREGGSAGCCREHKNTKPEDCCKIKAADKRPDK